MKQFFHRKNKEETVNLYTVTFMYTNYIKLIKIPIIPTTNPPIPTQRDILDILSFF